MQDSQVSLAIPLSSDVPFGAGEFLQGGLIPPIGDRKPLAEQRHSLATPELAAWQGQSHPLFSLEDSVFLGLPLGDRSQAETSLSPSLDGLTGLGLEEAIAPTTNDSLLRSSITPLRSLVIIDASVAEAEVLAAGVAPGTDVIILEPNSDGVEQISQILERYQNLASLHIVSHGDPGEVQLGNSRLNQGSLEDYGQQLTQWQSALSRDADILFYGCNLAAGDGGAAFVEQLAGLTGADIAASNDLTGASSQGGDWDLEVVVGALETALAFDMAAQQTYGHVLDTITSNGTDETLAGTANDDTFVFLDGWGNDSINGMAGTNTLDFSAVTTALSFTLDAAGNVSVSDGTNSLTATGDVVSILGGTGTDSFTIDADGNSITSAAGSITINGTPAQTIAFDSAVEQVTVTNVPASPLNNAVLNSGFQAFADLGLNLETYDDLATNLPLVNDGGSTAETPFAVGDLTDSGQILQQFQTDLAAAAPADATELETFLANWAPVINDPELGNLSITVDSSSVSPEVIAVAADGSQTASLLGNIRFAAQRTSQFNLSDIESLTSRGILFDPTATFDLDTTSTFDLSFEAAGDFELQVNEWSVAIADSATAANTAMRLGILDTAVSGSSIDLDVNASTIFKNVGTNGTALSLAELQAANAGGTTAIDALLDLNASGALDSEFTVTPTAQAGFVGPAAAVLAIDQTNIFDAALVEPSIALDDSLLSFTRLTADDLLAPLEQFEQWLAALENSTLYDDTLPLVDGGRVGDLLDFSGTLRDELIAKISDRTQITALSQPIDSATGQPSFSLSDGTSFTLTVNGVDSTISLGTSTTSNTSLADLIADINVAIATAGLAPQVQAEALVSSSSLITFTSQNPETDKIDVSFATAEIATAFGFGAGQNADNVASFETVQGLTAAIASVTGLSSVTSYDAPNNRLTFDVELSKDLAAVTKPFKPTLELEGIEDLTTASEVTLDSEVALDFRYGYDLLPTELPVIAPLENPTSLDISTGSLDYVFDLLIDEQLVSAITIARSSTAGLTDPLMLAGLINAELTTRGADSLVEAIVADGQVQFRAKSAQTSLTILAPDNDSDGSNENLNPVVQNLGFASSQTAGPELSPAFFDAANSDLTGTVRLDWAATDVTGRKGFIDFDFPEAAAQGTVTLATALNDGDGNGDGLISLPDLQVGGRGSLTGTNVISPGVLTTGKVPAPASFDLSISGSDSITVTLSPNDTLTAKALPTGQGDGSANANEFQLSGDATLTIAINGTGQTLTLAKADTDDNNSLQDLVADLQAAIGGNDNLDGTLEADSFEGRLLLSAVNPADDLQLSFVAGNPAEQLGFATGQVHDSDELLIGINRALTQAGIGDQVLARLESDRLTFDFPFGETLSISTTAADPAATELGLDGSTAQTASTIVNQPTRSGALNTTDTNDPDYVANAGLRALTTANSQFVFNLEGHVADQSNTAENQLTVTAVGDDLTAQADSATTELGFENEQTSQNYLIGDSAVSGAALSDRATFDISVNGGTAIAIEIPAGTASNDASSINNILKAAFEGQGQGVVRATLLDGKLSFSHDGNETISLSNLNGLAQAGDPPFIPANPGNTVATTELGLTGGDSSQPLLISNDLNVGTLGQLTEDATLSIALGSAAPVTVVVSQVSTLDNGDLAGLQADINGAIAATSLAGQVEAVLLGNQLGLQNINNNDTLTLSIPQAFEVQSQGAALDIFEKVNSDDIVEALEAASQAVATVSGSEVFSEGLPLLNLDAGGINDYGTAFSDLVADAALAPINSLQELTRAINELMGLDVLNPAFDPATAGVSAPGMGFRFNGSRLELDVLFVNEATQDYRFNLDAYGLASLDANGVPDALNNEKLSVLDGRGTLELDVESTATVNLDLELDYATDEPVITLEDDSDLTVDFQSQNDDLDFLALVGVSNLTVQNGALIIDGDGDASTPDFASYSGNFNGPLILDGRTFQDGSDFTTALTGQAEIELPFFQNASVNSSLGDPLVIQITDLEDAAFGTAGSVNIPNPDDLPDLAPLAESQFIELLRNPDFLINAIDRVLSSIQTAVEAPFAALENLPLIGDNIMDGVQPFFDDITQMRIEVRNFLETAYAETIGQANDGDLVAILQEALFDLFASDNSRSDTVLDNNNDGRGPRIGILKDLKDDGDALVDIDDVVVTTFAGNGNDGVQYDFHLGQSYSIALPFELGFGVGDLGLDELLPGFGFNVDGGEGVTFDFSWDLRFGFGVSEQELFYVNTDQHENIADTSSESVDELVLAIDVTVPGFNADVNLGLVGAKIDDGVEAPLKVTSLDAMSLSDVLLSNDNGLEGAFEVRLYKDNGGIDTNPVLLTFDNTGTGMRGGGILGALDAPARAARLITQLNLQLFELSTGGLIATPDLSAVLNEDHPDYDPINPAARLILTARDPDITRIEITHLSGNDFGFGGSDDIQFEDQRAVGLGFDDTQTASGGQIVAKFDAPKDGRINQDVMFTVTVGGEEVEVMLHTSTLDDEAELDDGTLVTDLAALAVQLNDVMELALLEAGLAATAVVASIQGGKLVLSGSSLEQIEWSRLDISFLHVEFTTDLVDPDDAGRLTLPEIFSDPLATLEAKLAAEAQARLHINTNADTVTDFVEDVIGFGGLGLPQIDFDFMVGFTGSLDITGGFEAEYDVSNLQFANIQVNVGELLSNLLGPVLGGVQEVLGPIFDILGPAANSAQGFLNAPIPVLSDLASLLGVSNDFSLLDFTGNKQAFNQFFDVVVTIIDLIDAFNDIDFDNGPIIVNLGCWELDFDKDSPTYFPRTKLPLPCEAVDIFEDLGGEADPISRILKLLGVSADGTSVVEVEPAGVKLDFLDPGNILNLILGETFDIVSINLPKLHLELGLDVGFDFKALDFGVGGGVTVDVDLGFVYDSTGLDRIMDARNLGLEPDYGDLLDGFYIRTKRGAEFSLGANFYGRGGIDITTPRICLGFLGCTPAFTIFALEAELYGNFSLGLDLRDPNEDGALRFDEIMDLTNDFSDPERLFFLFDIIGSANFGFDFSGTILGQTITAADLGIKLDIGGSFSAQDFFGTIFGFEDPFTGTLGEIIGGKSTNPSRVLRINAGEFDYARIHGDTDDSDGVKNWTVRSSGNDIIISDGSRSTTIANAASQVDSIMFRGTNADDSIDFSGLALPISVDARGGIGNDRIIGGDGNDLILGGSGRDEIEGEDGDDALYGDEGEDDIQGDAGDDILIGGRDNDTLAGGAGADLYRYGTTRSERGGWGQDTVNEDLQISNVSAGTDNVIRISSASHGLTNGDVITLSGLEGITNNGEAAEGAFAVTRIDQDTFELQNTSVGGTYTTGTGAFFKEARLLDIASVEDEFAYVADTGTVTAGSRTLAIESLGTEAGVFRITAFQHGLQTGDTVTVAGVEGSTNANGTFQILKVSDNRFDLKASTVHPAGKIRITSANHGLATGDTISVTGVGGVSNANGTYSVTRVSDDQILLNDSKFIGSYERRNGTGFIIAASDRTATEINSDPASKLKLLTDTLDFSALGSNKPLNITLDNSGTEVKIGSEEVPVNTVTLDDHNVETILGGRGEDDYNISANPSHFTRLDGQEGGDDYSIQLTDDLKGDVLIKDTGEVRAIDRLLIEGKDDANAPDTVGIRSEAIFFGPGKSIEYSPGGADSGLEQIKVDLLQGDDVINVESTPQNTTVAVNAGAGSDTFNVGVSLNDGGATTEANLNGLAGTPRSQGGAGPLILDGFDQEIEEDPDSTDVDRLNIFETTDTTGNNAANGTAGELTATALTGLGMDVGLEYGAMERLDLRLGQGDDELTLTGLTADSNSTIHGGGGSDNITVSGLTEAGNQALTVYGDTSADGEHRVDAAGNDVVDASAVSRTIVLDGGGGDDTLHGGSAKDFIAGGSGNDSLFGNAGDDEIYGDAGFDLDLDNRAFTITTSGRADGGNGNGDDFDSPGADTIEGGEGADIILGDQGLITRNTTGGLTTNVDLNDLGIVERIETTNEALGGEDRISGGAGADMIFGGVSLVEHPDAAVIGDEIDGGSGADIILGDAGIAIGSDGSADANDVLSRSPNLGGIDTISGGEDNDVIVGGSLGDSIQGNAGDDLILGDQGRITRNATDEIESVETTNETSAGNDSLEGNDGNDVILGGSGADSAQGNANDDIILGDNGKVIFVNNELDRVDSILPAVGGDDSLLSGDEGNDIVLGGAGADIITGAEGDDILLGDNGSVLYGEDGDRATLDVVTTPLTDYDQGAGDNIDGGANDDIIIGSVGDDLLYGREGKDKLLGDNGRVQFSNGALTEITTLNPDEEGQDELEGHEGDDVLLGGSGNDGLKGQAGADILLGDNGRIEFSNSQLTEITTLNPEEAGQDNLEGNEDNDVLLGGAGDDELQGQAGADILLGDNGQVLFDAGVIRRIETTESGIGGTDNISGDIGDDIGFGGFGDDSLTGGAGNDTLLGDNGYLDYEADGDLSTLDVVATPSTESELGGKDNIAGDEGDDRLLGGADDDTITGAAGHDKLIGDNGKFSFTAGQLTRLESLDSAGAGMDELEGNADDDVIMGGLGDDQIQGQLGDDILFGDGAVMAYSNGQVTRLESQVLALGGQDNLDAGEGNDIALGGSGDDQIAGRGGDDIISGDNGHVDYSLDGDLNTVDEIATPVDGAVAALGGSDNITGDEGQDIILGAAQGDTVSGGDGADIILGDNGKLSYSAGLLNRVTTALPEQGEDDRLLGDEGTDIVLGGEGKDSIEGGGDRDILLGDNGEVLYQAGTVSQAQTTEPGVGDDDEIDGGNALDWIFGGAGADRLFGQAGDDRILGDNGIADMLLDTVVSTSPTLGGQDSIYGGLGEDTIFGGTEADFIHGDEFDVSQGLWRIVSTDDFDLDGNDDFLWRELNTGELAVQFVVGNGVNVTQQVKAPLLRGSNFEVLGTGDFNGDGAADIVWRDRQTGIIDAWLMEGERYLSEAALNLPPLGLEWDVAAIDDFNRDGNADLFLRHTTVPLNLIWFMAGTNLVSASEVLGAPTFDVNWSIGGTTDFNQDGHTDILWRNPLIPEERVWFLNDENYLGQSVLNVLPSPNSDWAIAGIGDFNQDGNGDIIWQNQVDGLPVIWNLDAVEFSPSLFNAASLDWQLVGSGDFNDDGQADSVWRNATTGQTALRLMNNGEILRDTFVGPLVQDPNWEIRAVADFNGDGQEDLLWRHQVAGLNLLWGLNGTGLISQGLLPASTVDSNWRIAASGDFNGDGQEDLLWRSRIDGALVVWLLNNGVEFSSSLLQTPALDLSWTIEGIADVNQDGQQDLLLRNQNTNVLLARFLNGIELAGDAVLQLPNFPTQDWQIGAFEDFSNDGGLDLYWQNQLNGAQVLWGLDNVSFQSQQVLVVGQDQGLVDWFLEGSALIQNQFDSRDLGWSLVGSGDFNRDGQADGVWRNGGTGQTSIRLMNGDEVLQDIFVGPTVLDPNWEIQAIGDFDSDGHEDLLWRHQLGAQTLLWSLEGTKYRNSALLPATPIDSNWRIAGSGDFNGDEQEDLLWRNQVDGSLVTLFMDRGVDIGSTLLGAPALDLGWVVEGVADINQDGQQDLLLRNRFTNDILARFLNGVQLVGDAVINLPSLPDQSWQIGAFDDFGGDGQLDFYWRNQPTGLEVLWELNGTDFSGQRIVYGQQTADLILGDHGQRDFKLSREDSYQSIFTTAGDGGGNDVIYGDQGDDKILGQQGDDTIYGSSGEDDIIGGHNVLGGIDGADQIEGGSEADVILGDNGSIKRRPIDPESRTWERHDLPFDDVIRDIQRFDDSDRITAPDQLQGNGGDDIIHGQRGNDVISGGQGDDELYGDLGSDQIQGDDGHDTILGGTGQIIRDYSPNGAIRQDINGAWHRDVTLTEVVNVVNARDLATGGLTADELAAAEKLLLSGLYNPDGSRALNSDGSWKTVQQQLAIFADGADVISGGAGDDQIFGQGGDDQINAGEGENYVEGNGGADRIVGGSGNDFFIGDDQFNGVPWESQNPNVTHGLHLIEQALGGSLQLGTFGTVITPSVNVTANPDQGLLPILAVDQEGQAQNPQALGLTTSDGLTVEALVQLIPSVSGHGAWLPGNDTLLSGAGEDTVVGDDYSLVMPLRTGDAGLDGLLEELTRELSQLSYDLHDVEIGRDRQQPNQTLSIGNDILDGGSDDDLVVGDSAIAFGPLKPGLPNTDAGLGNRLADLRAIISQFDAQVLNVVSTLVADTTAPASGPNQLLMGNDNISGGEGDDHLFGDDVFQLSPVLDELPYPNSSFWDYGFSQQERPTSPNLPEWNRDQGNDIINGAAGSDFAVGDYGSIITPIVTSPGTDETELKQSLEQLQADVQTFLRDLYGDDHGIAHSQRDQSYVLRAGNDLLVGEAGDDLLFGDNANILLPWIQGQLNLNLSLQAGYLDESEEDYNFSHGLPRQHQLAHRSLDLNTTLAEDQIFGGLDNDQLFGQRGIDQLLGEAGDDALFGGSEADGLDGGIGINVVRTSNPSPKDAELLNGVINARLLELLTPELVQQLQETTQNQAAAILNGKFRVEAPS